jgi:hypothetical protein
MLAMTVAGVRVKDSSGILFVKKDRADSLLRLRSGQARLPDSVMLSCAVVDIERSRTDQRELMDKGHK